MRRRRRIKIIATLGPASSDKAVVASLFDATRERGLDAKFVTDLLGIHRFAFVMESDTVRNDFQTRQTRQAVVYAIGDSIGDVVRICIVALVLQR